MFGQTNNNQTRDSTSSENTYFKTPTTHNFSKYANPFADRTAETVN
jgi:hypothetical protein